MMNYKTPDVYIQEKSVLPSSVVSADTAVPAFIGYTEKALDGKGQDLKNKPTRIKSMHEYQRLFGGAKASDFTVMVDAEGGYSTTAPKLTYRLYYCMQLFFANGGGDCYVVSVGNYSATPASVDIIAGIDVLKAEDGPTLIVPVDAVGLVTDVADADTAYRDYKTVCDKALVHCAELQDRFALLDVFDKPASFKDLTGNNDVNFRSSGIGMSHLNYGAAYYPNLKTTFSYAYDKNTVLVEYTYGLLELANSIRVSYAGPASDSATITITEAAAGKTPSLSIANSKNITITIAAAGSTPTEIMKAWNAKTVRAKGKFTVKQAGDGSVSLKPLTSSPFIYSPGVLSSFEPGDTYHNIVALLARQRVTLPPSAAMAGVMATIDHAIGSWKAPANVSLNAVTGPSVNISNDDQEALNVDALSGKSINAIRAFNGKGTLVWGARTLDGNSNEWRYVPVRRLFIQMESDIKRATSYAVFEPNTAMTWTRLHTQVESYLTKLWQDGGLAGAKADEAFFVRIGLGETMDAQDILEGRLNITVGAAAVRPAEFVVFTFTHKLQES